MIEIDRKIYTIDIDAIMAWVSETPINERNVDTTTIVSYPFSENPEDDEEEMSLKEVNETKSTKNEVFNNMRYDLIKNLLNIIFVQQGDEYDNSLYDLSLGAKIALNTLIDKKIIIEKEA